MLSHPYTHFLSFFGTIDFIQNLSYLSLSLFSQSLIHSLHISLTQYLSFSIFSLSFSQSLMYPLQYISYTISFLSILSQYLTHYLYYAQSLIYPLHISLTQYLSFSILTPSARLRQVQTLDFLFQMFRRFLFWARWNNRQCQAAVHHYLVQLKSIIESSLHNQVPLKFHPS